MRRTPIRALAAGLLLLAGLCTPVASHAVDTRTVNDGNVVLEDVPEVPESLRAQLNRYLNTRRAGFADWVGEGEGLYITTRFGDVSQLHRVDAPGGARHQLTFFDEPIGGIVRRPGDATLIFSMDAGGNEFAQLFRLDPASGEHRMLTDGESRNGSAVWNRDGSLLAFQSTRRDGRSNDVWLMEADRPETARVVVEAPDGAWWAPMDFSADGRWLLIAQYVSITDSRIHRLDLDTGELTRIVGDPENPANVLGTMALFDAEDDGVFYATDEDGDFQQLNHLDFATGERAPITGDIPWNVHGLRMDAERRRGMFVVNEGGIDRVWLLDPRTFDIRRIESLPTSKMGAHDFSPDGRRLALTLDTASTPSDVFVLALGEDALDYGDLTRWTWSEVGGLDTDSFVEPELIDYPTFDERRIPAFVYRPHGEGPHPVIVYIHGGPESQFRPGFSATFQSWIAELGVAIVAPNVRGSAGYGKEYVRLDNGFLREDSVKDIGALLDWIATQPDLDASRVAVYGGSYGGYMVLASLMHYGDRLRAGVDVVGISNFVTFLENTQDYRRDLRRVEYGDERDPEMRAHLEAISPNNNAERITAPLFVAQGQNDPRVPVTESQQIVAAVRAAGYDVWYMNALNEGHGFRKKENSDLYREIAVMFLRRHLLGEGE
jgi:dipeptidyl aminopeptidase/acylaminoacyl peptidase